jgi:hypothetical protein
MSLVSCAICAGVSAMPGRRPYSFANVTPAFISGDVLLFVTVVAIEDSDSP